jgi:hypothetical protein
MGRRYPLIVLLALAIAMPAIPGHARSDDDGISIMTPEKGSVKPGKKRPARKYMMRRGSSKPVVRRGSSNPVYPLPLPAPQNLGVVPQQPLAVPQTRTEVPPPIVVPQTGRALPNLPPITGAGPGGAETFQDRAARCTHQAGVYGEAAGDRNAYIGSCINQ